MLNLTFIILQYAPTKMAFTEPPIPAIDHWATDWLEVLS